MSTTDLSQHYDQVKQVEKEILTEGAVDFLHKLHRNFNEKRKSLWNSVKKRKRLSIKELRYTF